MITDMGAAINAISAQFPAQPFVLIGHSAGGYNALMAALAPDISDIKVCEQIAGIVSLAGPTGAYPLTEEPYITLFPDRFQASDAPLGRDLSAAPPIMLVNGQDDTTVGPKNASDLAAALETAGRMVDLKLYEGMNHIDPVRFLSRYFDGDSPLRSDILGFIETLPRRACSE